MRGRWIALGAGALVLALLGGALAYYLTQVPDDLAKDYKERAEPEQQRVRSAMRPVYRTLSLSTFGADTGPLKKAEDERQYVRALLRVSSKELRQLRPARKAIAKARRTLAKVDEDKLFDVPDAPLLDGRGELPDADAIAADERAYLARARRFLRDYDRLISYHIKRTEDLRATGLTIARGFQKIPRTFTSPGQFTGPIGGVIKTLDRKLRKYRKQKVPADIKRVHRIDLGDNEFLIARLRDMVAAARRFDNAGLQKGFADLRRRAKRSERLTKGSVPRLVAKSRTAKAVGELRKRERELLAAFEQI